MPARIYHRERLPPLMQPFADLYEAQGSVDLVCVSGSRNDAEQLVDWEKGRRLKPGGNPALETNWELIDPISHTGVVTYAFSAADSAHGHAAAGDFHPVRTKFSNGMPATVYLGSKRDEPPEVYAEAIRLMTLVGEFAETNGYEWGGRYPHFDGPHVCCKGWRALPRYVG